MTARFLAAIRPLARLVTPLREALDLRVLVMVLLPAALAAILLKEHGLPKPVLIAMSVSGALGLVAWSWRDPELVLYALVAYLPFTRVVVGDFGTHLTALNFTNLLIAWLLLTALIAPRTGRPRWLEWTPLHGAILLFGATLVFGLAHAGWLYGASYVWDAMPALKRALAPLGLFFLTFWVVRNPRTLHTVLAQLMVSVAMVAMMSVWAYVTHGSGDLEWSRVRGISGEPNILGAFFASNLFLYLGFIVTAPRQPQGWLLWVPLLLGVRGVMVTFSRGAYLACVTGGLALSWLRSRRLFLIALAVVAVALLFPSVLPPGVRYRLSMTLEHRPAKTRALSEHSDLATRLEPSAGNRLRIWRGAVEMIKAHPVGGVGFGAFPLLLSRYTNGDIGNVDAHNLYLLLAAELGIPSLLVFLALLGLVASYAVRLYRRSTDRIIRALALGVLGGMVALATANSFTRCLHAQEAAGYFWVLLALLMRAITLESSPSSGVAGSPISRPLGHAATG